MSFNSNYFTVSNQIFEIGLQPNQFTILTYLIRMANNKGTCYPSMNTISEKCHASKPTVKRTIDELESAGFISVDRTKRFNVYTINYDKFETVSNREENKKQAKAVEPIVKQQVKSEEEQVVEATKCSIEEARQAIVVANCNKAVNDKIRYAIGVINNKKMNKPQSTVIPVNRYNTFNNFQQRNYSKEDFRKMEMMLLNK